jgi:hypothetical protein
MGSIKVLKLYGKGFTVVKSVLRAEPTIPHAGEFRVYAGKKETGKERNWPTPW